MTDISYVENPLGVAWRAAGSRFAVAAGAAMALASLLFHLPVNVAALRGAMVLVAILVVTRSVTWLLDRAPAYVADAGEAGPGGNEEARP